MSDGFGWTAPVSVMTCEDCGEVADLFMLNDPTWYLVSDGEPRRVYCWRCTEKRLGRKIVEDDLKLVPANRVYAALLRTIYQLEQQVAM